jgi:hypothetical protein
VLATNISGIDAYQLLLLSWAPPPTLTPPAGLLRAYCCLMCCSCVSICTFILVKLNKARELLLDVLLLCQYLYFYTSNAEYI